MVAEPCEYTTTRPQ